MKEYILVILSGILKLVEKTKYEKDKLEAFESGALVEFETLPTDIKKHVGEILLLDFLTPTMLEVDPSKWEVVEQWQYMLGGKWQNTSEHSAWRYANQGATTRLTATIKPKENSAHGYTEGSESLFDEFKKSPQEPTRKLVTDLIIEQLIILRDAQLDDDAYKAVSESIELAKLFKANEIDNIKHAFKDGKWESDHIVERSRMEASEYIIQTYQPK